MVPSDVAGATGMSASFLSEVENGKSDITFTRVVRLVNFYGINLHDLVPDRSPPDEIVVRASEQRLIRAASGIEIYLLNRQTGLSHAAPSRCSSHPAARRSSTRGTPVKSS